MLNYLFEVSLCWFGFYLLYVLWLSKETFFQTNRWYLIVTLLLGLLIPFAEISSFSSVEEEALTYLETVTVTVHQVEAQIATVVATPVSSHISVQEILFWIYGFGVLLMSLRFCFGLAQIFNYYKKSRSEKRKEYTLLQNEKVHLPFSFFHFLFISASAKYNNEELESIIRHELVHIKQAHSVDVLLLEILNIIFWCSPLIYFYRDSLRNVHEYLADEKVLQTTTKKQYGQLLLQQFQKGQRVAMANNFIHSQLKKRILMMTKTQSNKTARWKYLLAVPVFLTLFFVLSKTELIAQINDTANNELAEAKEERTHPVLKEKHGDPIFKVVEEMPRFPGCEEITKAGDRQKCSQKKMLEFIYTNIKYPEAARKAGIEGMAVVRFVIDKNGEIQSPEMLRTIGGGCDEEVLRIIGEMPTWIPGKQRGKKVDVYFNLPVKFKLEGEEKPKEEEIKESPKDINMITTEITEDVFKIVEEMPRFPGCEAEEDVEERKKCAQTKMLQFIYKNVKYPKEAQETETEGVVVVQFVIDMDGSVINPEIVRSLGNGLDQAVLDVVAKMQNMEDKWTPGIQRGRKVKVSFNLPVRFRLDPPCKSADEKETNKEDYTLAVQSFSMSPNPTRDQVRISFEIEDANGVELSLIDTNGRTISATQNITKGKNDISIDISKAASGIIFVTLRNGNKVFTKELLKQ